MPKAVTTDSESTKLPDHPEAPAHRKAIRRGPAHVNSYVSGTKGGSGRGHKKGGFHGNKRGGPVVK